MKGGEGVFGVFWFIGVRGWLSRGFTLRIYFFFMLEEGFGL